VSRWECGSFFPAVTASAPVGRAGGWWCPGTLWGSGRQALIGLLREIGPPVVHVPTYYCPAVVDDLRASFRVRRYASSPLGSVAPEAGPRDAVVAVSFFGAPPMARGCGGPFIVDATHDPVAPWLTGVDADYVFASLRKTLPLPDGGALWSPRGRPVPAAPPASDRHLVAAGDMLAAMCLKATYLDGGDVDKQAYLDLAAGAEFDGVRPGSISAYSRAALNTFPVHRWRAQRMANLAAFAEVGVERLPSTFGVVLRYPDREAREAARRALIAQRIYPAVLWDLTGARVPAEHRELSRQLLFLHADFRYTADDLRRVAAVLHRELVSC
jgi:hypothetical protein